MLTYQDCLVLCVCVYQQAVAPYCKDIMKSMVLVSGEVQDSSELLATFPEGKKSKGKDKESPVQETYQVDFLLPMVSRVAVVYSKLTVFCFVLFFVQEAWIKVGLFF